VLVRRSAGDNPGIALPLPGAQAHFFGNFFKRAVFALAVLRLAVRIAAI
jgi:hypothetical protein